MLPPRLLAPATLTPLALAARTRLALLTLATAPPTVLVRALPAVLVGLAVPAAALARLLAPVRHPLPAAHRCNRRPATAPRRPAPLSAPVCLPSSALPPRSKCDVILHVGEAFDVRVADQGLWIPDGQDGGCGLDRMSILSWTVARRSVHRYAVDFVQQSVLSTAANLQYSIRIACRRQGGAFKLLILRLHIYCTSKHALMSVQGCLARA